MLILPAFTISSDDRLLWVTTILEGKVRAFDISDPLHPAQVYEKQIGSQVNTISSSWDSKRLYFTSSILSKWDKKGSDNLTVLVRDAFAAPIGDRD